MAILNDHMHGRTVEQAYLNALLFLFRSQAIKLGIKHPAFVAFVCLVYEVVCSSRS